MCPVCGYRGSFSGLRWSGREVVHSRPTSADVKLSGVTPLFIFSFFKAWTGTTARFVQFMVTRLYTDVW